MKTNIKLITNLDLTIENEHALRKFVFLDHVPPIGSTIKLYNVRVKVTGIEYKIHEHEGIVMPQCEVYVSPANVTIHEFQRQQRR